MKSFKQFDEAYTDRFAHTSAEDDNKHLIYYNDPNDCGLKARKLIGNKEKIYFLSKNANDFFKKYVDPMQNIKRIINFIIEREKSSNS